MTMRVDPEAAPLDEPDHADDRALGDIIFDGEARVHSSSSIISMLDLFGGTSGQTLVRGSIRAWQRIGPSVVSSRWIAPGTSAAIVDREGLDAEGACDLGEVRIVAEVDLGEIPVEEIFLPLADQAELAVVEQQDLQRQPVAAQGRQLVDVHHDRAVAGDGDAPSPPARRAGRRSRRGCRSPSCRGRRWSDAPAGG